MSALTDNITQYNCLPVYISVVEWLVHRTATPKVPGLSRTRAKFQVWLYFASGMPSPLSCDE